MWQDQGRGFLRPVLRTYDQKIACLQEIPVIGRKAPRLLPPPLCQRDFNIPARKAALHIVIGFAMADEVEH